MRSLLCTIALLISTISAPAEALYFLDFPINSDREKTIADLEKINFHKLQVTLKDGTEGYYETETLTKLLGWFQDVFFELTLFHHKNPNVIEIVSLESKDFDDWKEVLDLRLNILEQIEKELGEPVFHCCNFDMDEEQKLVMADRFKDGEYPTMYSLWTFKDLMFELIADVDKPYLMIQSIYK